MEQTLNKSELVAIRDFQPEDLNFIMASWLRGLYYGDSIFSLMKKQAFMEQYHLFLEKLLKCPGVTVKVACLKEDPYVILGYTVLTAAPGGVHWTFVKKGWRGIGIAKDLIPKEVKTVSHLTKVGLSIVKNKGWDFNPFII